MGTLWQFFGFPDPEAPTPESVKRSKKKKLKAEEPPGQQLTLVSPDDPVVAEEAPAKVDSTNEQVNIHLRNSASCETLIIGSPRMD